MALSFLTRGTSQPASFRASITSTATRPVAGGDQVRLPGDGDPRDLALEALLDNTLRQVDPRGDLVEHLAAEGVVELLGLDVVVVPALQHHLAQAVEQLGDGDLLHLAAYVVDDAGEDRLDEAALRRVRPRVFEAVGEADVALPVGAAKTLEQVIPPFWG